ncbi:Peroxiredoxin [Aquimarina amphilecti]|uniref:thioredoxin-dependent peroxiredoxin n=1 Tax=Aquimarina amphilecti TaxID=1038014 RepID=A0A1H7W609_AQUAM|nr:redoxin domain-containing protein [Aquimarina amphilecti]SEM17032.1 Peroxiredoxin [Aquimarina amphilecti]
MNSILKSVFIAFLPLIGLYYTIMSTTSIIAHGLSAPIYFGQILIALSITLFFVLLFLKPVARTDENLKVYTTPIIIGLLISLWFGGFKESNINRILPSLGLFLGWVLYLKWYSIFSNRSENVILKKGFKFPKLEFLDINKNEVTTNEFHGNPTIYLFYRGNWCPLCMMQINEIASQYKELEKRKVNIVLISPQPHKHSKSLAEKYGLNFHFLQDYKNKAAKKIKILAKNGLPMGLQVFGYESDTVLPTVIITDSNHTIIFADLTDNYRVRPEPSTFINVIDSIS